MKRTIAAIAVFASAAAMPTPAVAMEQELTMLEAAVTNALTGIGMDVDVQSLTISQLAIIRSVLSSDDNDDQKANRIEAIISR